jgi:hypothetical protein
MEFELAKDFELIGGGVIPSGTILQKNENNKHYLMSSDFQMGFTEDQLISDDMFREVIIDETKVIEVDEQVKKEDNELVKKWRIQLDIVTTESKRKEMQKRIQEVVKEINERI